MVCFLFNGEGGDISSGFFYFLGAVMYRLLCSKGELLLHFNKLYLYYFCFMFDGQNKLKKNSI